MDINLETSTESPDFQSLFQDQSTHQMVDEPEASSSYRSNSGSSKLQGLNGSSRSGSGSGHVQERQYSFPYDPMSGSTLISSAVQLENTARGQDGARGQFDGTESFYHDGSAPQHRPPPLPMQQDQQYNQPQYLDYRAGSAWSPHPSPGLNTQQLPDSLYQSALSPGNQYVYSNSGAPSTNGAYTPSYAGSAFGDDFTHLIFDDADDSLRNLAQHEYMPSDVEDSTSVYAFSNHGDVGSRRGSFLDGTSDQQLTLLSTGFGGNGIGHQEQQITYNDNSAYQSHSHSPSPAPTPYTDQSFSHQQQETYTALRPRSGSNASNHSYVGPSHQAPTPWSDPTSPSPPVINHNYRQSLSSSPSPFQKPVSPPSLVIATGSPNLPPITTTRPQDEAPALSFTGASGSSVRPMGPPPQPSLNTLFPPTNPHLLTGMAGLSPVGPDGDGPMINIVPSTPTSGLREGRGVWEAEALKAANARAAAANAQLQASQQQQPPNGNQHSQQQPSLNSFAFPQQQQHQPQRTNSNPTSQPFPQLDSTRFLESLRQQGLSAGPSRPRSKSESFMPSPIETLSHQQQQQLLLALQNETQPPEGVMDFWTWQRTVGQRDPSAVDPRAVGGEQQEAFRYEPGMANDHFMSALNLPPVPSTSPAYVQNFGSQQDYNQYMQQPPSTAPLLGMPSQGVHVRRRSFGEGAGISSHPAMGAGTPGYGVEFAGQGSPGLSSSRVRGVGGAGHRRGARSEDLGRSSGWGMGGGDSTADFLASIINPSDGTLLPPAQQSRASSHPRRSSVASSVSSHGRSPSPSFSVSSAASSPNNKRMSLPAVQIPTLPGQGQPAEEETPTRRTARGKAAGKLPVRPKVTTVATEIASKGRRTNKGTFLCPVPGCGSTFTRHFNLKGHLRSHNEERPYKCDYPGCLKSFARQHDCKRHMLLHVGLRPFLCEGCGKSFARLDALSRHHKSEGGSECARLHPLPTNPDGTLVSEGKYRAVMGLGKAGKAAVQAANAQDGLVAMDEDEDDEEEDVSGMDEDDAEWRGDRKGVLL